MSKNKHKKQQTLPMMEKKLNPVQQALVEENTEKQELEVLRAMWDKEEKKFNISEFINNVKNEAQKNAKELVLKDNKDLKEKTEKLYKDIKDLEAYQADRQKEQIKQEEKLKKINYDIDAKEKELQTKSDAKEKELQTKIDTKEKELQTKSVQSEMEIERRKNVAEREAQELINEAKKKALADAKEVQKGILEKIKLREKELNTRSENLNKAHDKLEIDKVEIENKNKRLQNKFELLQEKMKQYDDASPEALQSLTLELKGKEQHIASLREELKNLYKKQSEQSILTMQAEGKNINDIQQENNHLMEQVEELQNRCNEYTALEMEEMKSALTEKPSLLAENNRLAGELVNYKKELQQHENAKIELESVRARIELINSLNEGLKKEIETYKKSLEAQTGDGCPNLTRIDNEENEKRTMGIVAVLEQNQSETTNMSLPEIVDHVRNYAATRTIHLYYTHEDISAFVAGLAASKFAILQGLSGTGKTSLPNVFAEAIGGECDIVSVQSSWRDSNELLGYYNDFNKKFTAKEFTCDLYRANHVNYSDTPYFIVLDEMNLSRVEYYFADFLSVLEKPKASDWHVQLLDVSLNKLSNTANNQAQSVSQPNGYLQGPQLLINGNTLGIPENIWFIGTANRDESTFEITDKVYDRAQVLNFNSKAMQFKGARTNKIAISYSTLQKLFKAAYKKYEFKYEDDEIIYEIDDYLEENFQISFGNRIGKQFNFFVPVYQAAEQGCNKKDDDIVREAIDYQIANKVLRKLESADFTKTKEFQGLLEICQKNHLQKCTYIIEKHLKS